MKLHQVRKTATALMAGALVAALIGYIAAEEGSFGLSAGLCVAAVAAIVGYWVVLMKFWRCPKCGAVLPTRQHFYSVKHCPECGEELDLNRW